MEKLCQVVDLGLREYQEVHLLQRKLVEERFGGQIPDTLILTEHPPVFTIGRSGSRKHILVPEGVLSKEGIEVYEVDRGGDITYHGPGQVVGYPILDLREYGKDVHLYLRMLEEVLIGLLDDYGIRGRRVKGLTGVWVGEKKIAAIGVGIRRWVTFHGFCLNLDPRKEHFAMINPCGLNKEITSLKELGVSDFREVRNRLINNFGRVFKRKCLV